jgi:hypothetical protein
MTVIEPPEDWTPPEGEWTELDHMTWVANHHREFRVIAERERAALTEQLRGAVEALDVLLAACEDVVQVRNGEAAERWHKAVEQARAAVGGQ